MTLQEAKDLDVVSASYKELEKAYKKLRAVEKKNKAAIEQAGRYSPAVERAKEKNVYKNLSKNASRQVVQKRLIAAQKLSKAQTGTLSGLKAYEKTIGDRLGVNYEGWAKSTKDSMWEMYEKMNSPQFFQALGSDELQRKIAELTSKGYRSEEKIVEALNKYVDNINTQAEDIPF